jgi:large subunit ribosomal protein L31
MQKLPRVARRMVRSQTIHPHSYPQVLWITSVKSGHGHDRTPIQVAKTTTHDTRLVDCGAYPYNSRPSFEPAGSCAMKDAIHPNYKAINVTCSCGNTFETRSTLGQDLQIEVCSNCHPFYTGKQKMVDTGGRVDRFRKKYATGAAKA